jgi:sugar phosphate isomerase/epimerase
MSLGTWADYSGGRPTGAALKAAGFAGAIRYVGLGATGKRLTAAEYKDLTGAGLQVLLVAELGTTDTWGTSTDDDYARGKANALASLADARAAGVPDSVGIAGASDAHTTAQWQINDTVTYISAFRDVLGIARAGHYGFSDSQTAVHAAGVASWYWRCGSQPTETWVAFWQRNSGTTTVTVSGIQCDVNEQYLPIGAPDMLLTDLVRLPNWAGADTPTTTKTVNNCLAEDNIRIQQIAAAVAGLTSALAAATTNPAITPQMVTDAINAAVAAHVKVNIDVTP